MAKCWSKTSCFAVWLVWTIRPGQRCRMPYVNAGKREIKVIMVTGDHPHTALAIGRQIGQIQTGNPVVITGGSCVNCLKPSFALLWMRRTLFSPGSEPIKKCASSSP